MRFGDMLRTDLIFVKEHFGTQEEAICYLSERVNEKGLINDGFLKAILERERNYPTGLFLGKINVAIPHTDIEYVKQPGVAIATLVNPVMFKRLDDISQTIPVHIIFLLLISQPDLYIDFLSKLTSVFSNEGSMKSIYESNSPDNICEILKEIL